MEQPLLTKAQRALCVKILSTAPEPVQRVTQDALANALPLIVRMIDEDVIKALPPQEASLPATDRLFDVLMVRFECLQPYRAGILTLSESIRHSPDLAYLMYKLQSASLRSLLAATHITGISTLRLHVLLGLYHITLSRWAQDETPDLAKTMAFLNTALQKCAANKLLP